ncbi:MAG: heat-inducible transcriptional repressor HrcA, partial [Candidatus Schekmanbacteria bacterium]
FRGYSLIEIKLSLENMLLKEKEKFDRIINKAMAMCKVAFDKDESADIYYHGTSNILEKPDFTDIEELKLLLKAFEEKSAILKLLNKCLQEKGVAIYIGAESSIEKMEDISVIASTYSTGEKTLGTLGIVGPKRMDYSELIPLVALTAKLITNHFSRI